MSGDLYSLQVLDFEGQKLLKKFKKTNTLKEELLWLEGYRLKEFSSTHALEVEHKYQLHKLSNKDYSTFLNNAVIAKGNIGVASLDIWAFGIMVECYQAYCIENNYSYKINQHSIHLPKVTDQEAKLLVHIYTRLVQENVIESVKHKTNGSKGFEIYYLNNIGEKSNEKQIRKDLTQDLGLSSAMVDKLLIIIRFAKDNNNLPKACRNFLSLYNKGRSPLNKDALDYWESFIVENSYFGNLIKPLYDIKLKFEETYSNNLDSLDDLLNTGSLELASINI